MTRLMSRYASLAVLVAAGLLLPLPNRAAAELIELTFYRREPFAKGVSFGNVGPYEKLVGDLAGAYSRRIDIRHRLVYQILKKERIVKVIRMWTHYE